MKPLPDLYTVLGARPDDSSDRLKANYRAAARRNHPDIGGEHRRFVEIDAAWQVLSDPSSRWCYDSFWGLSILMADDTFDDVDTARRAANDATLAVNLCAIPQLLHGEIVTLHGAIPSWLAAVERRAVAGVPRAAASNPARHPRIVPAQRAPVVGLGPLHPHVHAVVTAGVVSMTRWQAMNQLLQSVDLTERRAARDAAFEAYQSLRAAQDALARPGAMRTDAAVRVYFHICCSALTLRGLLVDPRVRLSRVYPVTDEGWLEARVEESRELLASRRILPGAPPWALDEASAAVAGAVSGPAAIASAASVAAPVRRGPIRSRPALQGLSRWSSRSGSGLLVAAFIGLLGLGPGSPGEGEGRGVALLTLAAVGLALVMVGVHFGSRVDRRPEGSEGRGGRRAGR